MAYLGRACSLAQLPDTRTPKRERSISENSESYSISHGSPTDSMSLPIPISKVEMGELKQIIETTSQGTKGHVPIIHMPPLDTRSLLRRVQHLRQIDTVGLQSVSESVRLQSGFSVVPSTSSRAFSPRAPRADTPTRSLTSASSSAFFSETGSGAEGARGKSSESEGCGGRCPCRTYLLHRSLARQCWDVMIMGCLIYFVFVTPPVTAFLDRLESYPFFDGADKVMDIIFIVDVLINMVSAYEAPNDAGLVTSNYRILIHYFKGWFLLDALSSFPSAWIDFSSDDRWGHLSRLTRVLKLLKVIRMGKLLRILPRLQERCQVRNTHLDMAKFIVSIILSAHWLGCLFFMVSRLQDFPIDSWTQTYRDGEGILHLDVWSQYTISLYWAVTTMTTIGYGDIVPGTPAETGFALIAMWVGAFSFAYIMTSVVSTVFDFNQDKVSFERLMDKVLMVLLKKRISAPLRTKVQKYMFFRYLNSNADLFDSTTQVLQYLSPTLKGAVMIEITAAVLDSTVFVKLYGLHFLRRASQRMKMGTLAPGELVVRHGSVVKHMHFIATGFVQLLRVDDSSESIARARTHSVPLLAPSAEFSLSSVVSDKANRDPELSPIPVRQWVLGENCCFGEMSSLLGLSSMVAVFTLTHADIYRLDGKVLYELLVDEFNIHSAQALFLDCEERITLDPRDFTREESRVLTWTDPETMAYDCPSTNIAHSLVKCGTGHAKYPGLPVTLPASDKRAAVLMDGMRVLNILQHQSRPQQYGQRDFEQAELAKQRTKTLVQLLFGDESAKVRKAHAEKYKAGRENQTKVSLDPDESRQQSGLGGASCKRTLLGIQRSTAPEYALTDAYDCALGTVAARTAFVGKDNHRDNGNGNDNDHGKDKDKDKDTGDHDNDDHNDDRDTKDNGNDNDNDHDKDNDNNDDNDNDNKDNDNDSSGCLSNHDSRSGALGEWFDNSLRATRKLSPFGSSDDSTGGDARTVSRRRTSRDWEAMEAHVIQLEARLSAAENTLDGVLQIIADMDSHAAMQHDLDVVLVTQESMRAQLL